MKHWKLILLLVLAVPAMAEEVAGGEDYFASAPLASSLWVATPGSDVTIHLDGIAEDFRLTIQDNDAKIHLTREDLAQLLRDRADLLRMIQAELAEVKKQLAEIKVRLSNTLWFTVPSGPEAMQPVYQWQPGLPSVTRYDDVSESYWTVCNGPLTCAGNLCSSACVEAR